MERLPAVFGLFLCSSHGGSLAVIDGDHNPTLNALQVKSQQQPRLFTQDEWVHRTGLTGSKRAVSAQRSWSNPAETVPEVVPWMETLDHRVVYSFLHL